MNNNKLMGDRLLSIDLLRGMALLGVVMVHAIIFGIWYNIDTALNSLNTFATIILSPVILLAPMAGLFVFISAIANLFTASRRMDRGVQLRYVIQPIIITSTVLLLLHFVFASLFNHNNGSMFPPEGNLYGYPPGRDISSLVTASIQKAQLILPGFENLILMEALGMLAMSGFFIALTLWLLWRKGGYKKTERNMKILLITGLVWTFVAPFLWAFFWNLLNITWNADNGFIRALSIPLSLFGAKRHPITTIAPFALFGMWLAHLVILRPERLVFKRKAQNMAILMTILFFVTVGFKAFITLAPENPIVGMLDKIGIIKVLALNTPPKVPGDLASLFSGDLKNAIFNFYIIPTELFFLGMTMAFWIIPLIIRRLDYRSSEDKLKLAKRIRPIKRFGTVSLSIFFLESVLFTSISRLFHTVFGDPSLPIDDMMSNPLICVFYTGTVVGIWFLFLFLWEKINYKFGMEWLIQKVTSPLRKEKSTKFAAASNEEVYIKEQK